MSAVDIKQAAEEYRARGWAPLPVKARDKKPAVGNGWQNFVADDSTQYPDNLGILLGQRSRGLIDVDLDCSEAVILAPDLLPPTDAIFGRESKRGSHWLYACDPPPETTQYKDAGSGMIAEVRSTGAQTVFPPSTHFSGESIEWGSKGEPAKIDGGELLRRVADLAGLSLLIRHWPEENNRYNAEGALAGALLRAGRDGAEVEHLLTLIQQQAGAARDHKPAKTVDRLSQKLAENKPVPGLPKLREHVGAAVTDQVAEWMGLKSRAADPTTTHKSSSIIRAADIVMRPKEWIWEGHLLRGAQELLTGIPGLGKSQVQISYVACVSAGLVWPDGARANPAAAVIMLTAEDVLDQEVVPRLHAAGADLKLVHFLKCIKTDEKTSRQFLLGDDLDELERAVRQVGNVALITIDPITAYMGGKMDSHKSTEVRAQLGPLKDFAERMNVAVSTITHPPKSSGQKAIDHFIGSQAFIAAGRIGHLCVEETKEEKDAGGDEDDGKKGGRQRTRTGRILFANAKNNPHTIMPTLAYRIEEIIVGQDPKTGDNIAAPHVVWDKETVDISADEAVASAAEGKNRGGAQEVQVFLKHILKGGPVPLKIIEDEATRRGFSDNQLRTAKEKLKIISEKSGFEGGWVWKYGW